jgi:hypothetical protein
VDQLAHLVESHWAVFLAIGTSLSSYHIISAFVDTLPMPNLKSTQFYRFCFAFLNRIAANYNRASAANGPAGQQPPKGE